jgi:hypothetical protein
MNHPARRGTFAGHYTNDETWNPVTGAEMAILTLLAARGFRLPFVRADWPMRPVDTRFAPHCVGGHYPRLGALRRSGTDLMHVQMVGRNTAENGRLIDSAPNETAGMQVTALKGQKMFSDTNESTTGERNR